MKSEKNCGKMQKINLHTFSVQQTKQIGSTHRLDTITFIVEVVKMNKAQSTGATACSKTHLQDVGINGALVVSTLVLDGFQEACGDGVVIEATARVKGGDDDLGLRHHIHAGQVIDPLQVQHSIILFDA